MNLSYFLANRVYTVCVGRVSADTQNSLPTRHAPDDYWFDSISVQMHATAENPTFSQELFAKLRHTPYLQ